MFCVYIHIYIYILYILTGISIMHSIYRWISTFDPSNSTPSKMSPGKWRSNSWRSGEELIEIMLLGKVAPSDGYKFLMFTGESFQTAMVVYQRPNHARMFGRLRGPMIEIHPRSLTVRPCKMGGGETTFLLGNPVFKCYVKLPGSIHATKTHGIAPFIHRLDGRGPLRTWFKVFWWLHLF